MVLDPELGENLVDLGLIYHLDVDDRGVARVEMSTTTRGCPAAAYLQDAVESAVRIVPGIQHVDVLLTYEPPWSPDRMSDAVIQKLGGGSNRR
jgi:metal-sulfur cluster biosynthetic enzyme